MSILHQAIKENNREKIVKNIKQENYLSDEKGNTPFGMLLLNHVDLINHYDSYFISNIEFFTCKDIYLYSEYLLNLYKQNPSLFYSKMILIKKYKQKEMFGVVRAGFNNLTGKDLFIPSQ